MAHEPDSLQRSNPSDDAHFVLQFSGTGGTVQLGLELLDAFRGSLEMILLNALCLSPSNVVESVDHVKMGM